MKKKKKIEKEKKYTRNKILFFFFFGHTMLKISIPTIPLGLTNFRLACSTLYNSLPEREVSLDTHVYKTTISKAHRNLTPTLVFLEGVPTQLPMWYTCIQTKHDSIYLFSKEKNNMYLNTYLYNLNLIYEWIFQLLDLSVSMAICYNISSNLSLFFFF